LRQRDGGGGRLAQSVAHRLSALEMTKEVVVVVVVVVVVGADQRYGNTKKSFEK